MRYYYIFYWIEKQTQKYIFGRNIESLGATLNIAITQTEIFKDL